MKRSIVGRLLRRLEWVSRQKGPFGYVDFEVENEVSHRAAQHYLGEMEKLGLVERTHGTGGLSCNRTVFRTRFELRGVG